MIKVKIHAGDTDSEAIVWSAKYVMDRSGSSAYLYTGLDESSHIKIERGNIVTIMPLSEEDTEESKIKIYGNGDLKNLCETIKCSMVWKTYDLNVNNLVTFRQISEICTPAFQANIMSLEHNSEYIYSRGANSLSDKIYHDGRIKTGLIKNVTIGRKTILLVGGFKDFPVRPMTERALHEFATVVNNHFPG